MVWVLGNHDRHLAHVVAKLIGVETTEAFRWSYGGRSFVALHGDRFDSFISKLRQDVGLLLARLRFRPTLAVPQRRVAKAARPRSTSGSPA